MRRKGIILNLQKKYRILLVIIISIGIFARTHYAKDIANTIKIIKEDQFTTKMRDDLEKLPKQDTPIIIKAFANQQKTRCPIKNSKDDFIIDVISEENKIVWVRKTNYETLLNLPNINHDKIKLSKILTDNMTNEICSQKVMNYLIQNKDVSVEYKFFDFDMSLVDDKLVQKNDCRNWENNNQIYVLINNIFEFLEK